MLLTQLNPYLTVTTTFVPLFPGQGTKNLNSSHKYTGGVLVGQLEPQTSGPRQVVHCAVHTAGRDSRFSY